MIPQPKKYISDFEQMGFGMFVHWGLYSQLEKGEWKYFFSDMTMEEYSKLADTFTAENFDAEKLVLLAKNAGCKYVVLTTRHHEGFSLYDTCGLHEFDSVHSAAKRDLVREFVDACRKYDIVPFLYHTLIDWSRPEFENDFNSYLEYLRKSVEILCKNYGKIGGFWFDGSWNRPDADWQEDELYGIIRKYQPEAMIINNSGLSGRGRVNHPEIDAVTFEQKSPNPLNREGMEKYRAAETCCTVNNYWGYGKYDFNYKSPKELIELLCNCRRLGANLLLNIGLEGDGRINPFQEHLFGILGKWMGLFGESIYNARPSNVLCLTGNYALKSVNGDCWYIYALFNRKQIGVDDVTVGKTCAGPCAFSGFTDKIKKIEWLDNGAEADFIQKDDMLSLHVGPSEYGEAFCVRVAKAYVE